MPRTSHLDPRAPLVVDTRELGRRPGTLVQVDRTVPAGADLALDLVAVAPGSPMRLAVRLEAVVEGVLVTGTVTAGVVGECARCLGPVHEQLTAPVQELYGYQPAAEDEEAPVVDGDLLDLEPVVRDAVLLGLPPRPLCRADCPGLCPACGVRLADHPGHEHPATDPRWAALASMFDDNRADQES